MSAVYLLQHRPTVYVLAVPAGAAVAFPVPPNAVSVLLRCRSGVAKWSDAGVEGEPLPVYATIYQTESLPASGPARFDVPLARVLYFDALTDVESGEDYGDAAVVELIVS